MIYAQRYKKSCIKYTRITLGSLGNYLEKIATFVQYHHAIFGFALFRLKATGNTHEQRFWTQLDVCVVVKFLDARVAVRALVAVGEAVVAMPPEVMHCLLYTSPSPRD